MLFYVPTSYKYAGENTNGFSASRGKKTIL